MNGRGRCSSDFKYGAVHGPSPSLSRQRESCFNHAGTNSSLERDGVSMKIQFGSPNVCMKCVTQDCCGRGSDKPPSSLPLRADISLVQQLSLYLYETSGSDTRILDKYILIKRTELVSFGSG